MAAEMAAVRAIRVAVATVMGETFPEYEEWYEVALGNDFGWGDLQQERMEELYVG